MSIASVTIDTTTSPPVPSTVRGKGFSGGSYDASTGVVTFTSNDGLGFVTGDLRGNLAAPGTIGGTTPGAATFTTLDVQTSSTLTGAMTHASGTVKLCSSGGDMIVGGSGTPGAQLEVYGATQDNVLKITSSDANCFMSMVDNSTTNGYVRIGAIGNKLVGTANNVDVLNVEDTGVTLSPTNADFTLRVDLDQTYQGYVEINTDTNEGMGFYYDDNTNACSIFRRNTSTRVDVMTFAKGSSTVTFETDEIVISTAQTPASASATGTAGTFCWDTSYLYICTAPNTWRRVAHATW